jgi:F-type H+-transporting ATPase subunit b
MKTRVWILTANFALIFCVSATAAEAPEAAQPGIFSGSMADSIWTVIAFVILVLVLGKFAWRPLLEGLKAREERIRQEVTTAENARKQAEKTLQEYNSRMERLEQQGRQITEKAAKEAEKLAKEIAEKARLEAVSLKQRAQSDIEAAHKSAKDQLWDEVGDIMLALGNRVMGRMITDEDNQRLIREAVEKLKSEQLPQG